jgi:hypothetical protein
MRTIVRGNEIEFIGTFRNPSNPNTQPLEAAIRITFPIEGGRGEAEGAMVKGSDGLWRWTWDSTVAIGGRVDYWGRCWGNLVAADDGSFILQANSANQGGLPPD